MISEFSTKTLHWGLDCDLLTRIGKTSDRIHPQDDGLSARISRGQDFLRRSSPLSRAGADVVDKEIKAPNRKLRLLKVHSKRPHVRIIGNVVVEQWQGAVAVHCRSARPVQRPSNIRGPSVQC